MAHRTSRPHLLSNRPGCCAWLTCIVAGTPDNRTERHVAVASNIQSTTFPRRRICASRSRYRWLPALRWR